MGGDFWEPDFAHGPTLTFEQESAIGSQQATVPPPRSVPEKECPSGPSSNRRRLSPNRRRSTESRPRQAQASHRGKKKDPSFPQFPLFLCVCVFWRWVCAAAPGRVHSHGRTWELGPELCTASIVGPAVLTITVMPPRSCRTAGRGTQVGHGGGAWSQSAEPQPSGGCGHGDPAGHASARNAVPSCGFRPGAQGCPVAADARQRQQTVANQLLPATALADPKRRLWDE